MINEILVGAGIVLVAAGLAAPTIVSSRGPASEIPFRPALKASPPAAIADTAGEGAATGEAAGFLGVVVALQSVDLSARFDGTLERLDVQVGDHVKGGAAIGHLDGRSIARDLAMAEAALRVAEAEHDRLMIEQADASDRAARLHSIAELVSREQLAAADSLEQVASARLRGSVADLAGKRARTDQLRETSHDTQIIAPFDGIIAARYVDAGTTVSRSAPIVRLISPDSLVIRFAVPEEQASGIATGRRVIVQVASAGLTANGRIERIAPEIDAALRMVVVEARLSPSGDRPPAIPSGAAARVRFAPDPDTRRRCASIGTPLIPACDGPADHE